MSRPWWNPWSDEPTESVAVQLEHLLTHMRVLEAQGKKVLMASGEIKAGMARINAALGNIASDIRRLKDVIKPGMTEAEVAEAQGIIDGTADRAESMAADPENPDPPATA